MIRSTILSLTPCLVFHALDYNTLLCFYSIGLVTSVKNQMSCGSCAAFAITGVHEVCMLKAGARFNGLDLSEQQLLDCGYNGK